MMTTRHKFVICNPCSPCEYHIELGVKIFVWFDLLLQALFIFPVVVQFKIHLCYLGLQNGHADHKHVCTPEDRVPINNVTGSSRTGNPASVHQGVCNGDLVFLAVLYSILDVVNLGVGISTDIFLYIGACQSRCLCLKFTAAWIFFIFCIIRFCLHICGVTIHIIRCSADTYAYEIITRLLMQYLIYGIWLAGEYIGWLHRGQLFVPRKGLMEPPGEESYDEVKPEYKSMPSLISIEDPDEDPVLTDKDLRAKEMRKAIQNTLAKQKKMINISKKQKAKNEKWDTPPESKSNLPETSSMSLLKPKPGKAAVKGKPVIRSEKK